MQPSSGTPIVTFTTDFGLSDHYVGTMKGVVLRRCPHAHLVDICHGITPFSVVEGAYTIAQAALFYPAGAIHVVVVDPGVGSQRKGLLAEVGSDIFIAPDNGVLSLVFARTAPSSVRELTNGALFEESVSATFHGRDIFAAVAGSLASGGFRPEDVGELMHSWEMLAAVVPVERGRSSFSGTVLSVDHFGNVITNLPAAQFRGIQDGAFELQVNGYRISNLYRTFALAPPEKPFVYFGSSGYLELGINGGLASQLLAVRLGDHVRLEAGP